jgi:hypothetical protein
MLVSNAMFVCVYLIANSLQGASLSEVTAALLSTRHSPLAASVSSDMLVPLTGPS